MNGKLKDPEVSRVDLFLDNVSRNFIFFFPIISIAYMPKDPRITHPYEDRW